MTHAVMRRALALGAALVLAAAVFIVAGRGIRDKKGEAVR